MTIDDVLCRLATIHQQHSTKCWLALQDLNAYLNFTPDEWEKLNALLDMQEPKIDLAIIQSNKITAPTPVKRRHWILSHAIYPQAYYTMQQWIAEAGADSVFNYYLEEAAKENNLSLIHI